MVSALFDRAAAGYDSWYETELGREADRAERSLIENMFIPPGPRILEVGCGTGQYTTWLAQQGLELTAVDVSREMLAKAQAKLAALNLKAGWLKADINEILHRLGRYHGILSMTAFEFIPKPEQVLQKLFQHLEAGGCLVIGVIAGESAWSEQYQEIARAKPTSVFAQANFYSKAEIRSWQVGGRLELAGGLYFPPSVKSVQEALDLEQRREGNPGFLAAKWVKDSNGIGPSS